MLSFYHQIISLEKECWCLKIEISHNLNHLRVDIDILSTTQEKTVNILQKRNIKLKINYAVLSSSNYFFRDGMLVFENLTF